MPSWNSPRPDHGIIGGKFQFRLAGFSGSTSIKDATVKRYHYDDRAQLERHLADFVATYNFARRLKTLKGLTPYEFICKRWTNEPEKFRLNPIHQIPGLNI